MKNLRQSTSGDFTFEIVGQWDEVPLNQSTSLGISGEIQWSHNQGDDVPESIYAVIPVEMVSIQN